MLFLESTPDISAITNLINTWSRGLVLARPQRVIGSIAPNGLVIAHDVEGGRPLWLSK